MIDDRSSPFVLWAHTQLSLPEGKQRLLLRSRSAARLFIDDKLVVENPFQSNKTDGHNPYKPVESSISPRIRPLQPGDHEEVAEIDLPAGSHRVRLEIFVGGKKRRPELGETSVAIAPGGTDDFSVIGFSDVATSALAFPLQDDAWIAWERARQAEMVLINQRRRAEASAEYAKYWQPAMTGPLRTWGRPPACRIKQSTTTSAPA